MIVRVVLAFALAVSLLFGASGCGVLMPEGGSYQKTIPAALEQAGIGITQATAGTGIDGFSPYVSVYVDLDAGAKVDAELLHKVLAIAVPLVDQPGADSFELKFYAGAHITDGKYYLGDKFDLSDARAQLLSTWEGGDEWGFAVTDDFEINAKLDLLRQYLRDREGE